MAIDIIKWILYAILRYKDIKSERYQILDTGFKVFCIIALVASTNCATFRISYTVIISILACNSYFFFLARNNLVRFLLLI